METGIAVLETKWWRKWNTSVRGTFEMIAEQTCENPHAYHYEMANSRAAFDEAFSRIASYRNCQHLYLAMHGSSTSLDLFNEDAISADHLANSLVSVKNARGSKLDGVYLASCAAGGSDFTEKVFAKDVGITWLAGFSTEVDWLPSIAMDILFFNELIFSDEETPITKIRTVAEALLIKAPGLIQKLGFGIHVKKRGGGSSNLLTQSNGDP